MLKLWLEPCTLAAEPSLTMIWAGKAYLLDMNTWDFHFSTKLATATQICVNESKGNDCTSLCLQ